MERYYYKDNLGNKFSFKKERSDLIEITEEEFYKKKSPTKEQLERKRIQELKSLLSSTDYKIIKYMEGKITEEEFKELSAQRQEWRDEINKLEEKQ